MFDFMNDRAPDEGFTVEADPALEVEAASADEDGGNARRGWKRT